MNREDERTVQALLERAGGSYAAEAGIKLADRPAPLFQLLMFAQLASTRIGAGIAVAATRELVSSGYTTPRRIADADWQELVDALGRAHYKRYDESNATRLGENAALVLERYAGDLRRMAEESGQDVVHLAELLQQYHGIGPTGAEIFLREVQDTWTWVRPYFDDRARKGAAQLHLPGDPKRLAELAPPDHDAELAAALVRITLDKDLAAEIRSAAH